MPPVAQSPPLLIAATLSLLAHAALAALCFYSPLAPAPRGGSLHAAQPSAVAMVLNPSSTPPPPPTSAVPQTPRAATTLGPTPSTAAASASAAATPAPAPPPDLSATLAGAPTLTALPGASPSLTFAGLDADSEIASSVVYVVDTSGPMVSSLPWVIAELRRSAASLLPTQQFTVVFFSDRGGSAPVTRTFSPKLVDASPRQLGRLDSFLNTADADGRSSPLAGLREALRLRPRVVFLLCRAIPRTNGNQWDAGRDAILRELDTLNPADAATGKRSTSIKVIQFLEPDPTGLLQDIALAHGGPSPAAALRTISRNELNATKR